MSNPRVLDRRNRRNEKPAAAKSREERRFDDALAQALTDVRTEGQRRALPSASEAKGEVCAAGRTVLDADGRSMGIGDALDD